MDQLHDVCCDDVDYNASPFLLLLADESLQQIMRCGVDNRHGLLHMVLPRLTVIGRMEDLVDCSWVLCFRDFMWQSEIQAHVAYSHLRRRHNGNWFKGEIQTSLRRAREWKSRKMFRTVSSGFTRAQRKVSRHESGNVKTSGSEILTDSLAKYWSKLKLKLSFRVIILILTFPSEWILTNPTQ